ncbi:MAG TPA: ATP-binding protein [Chthoniobacterales bacterium]|jgi:heavy metal sensor kinase|nr:ATP-binding protein [Chthoniobacterales bacterium]
MNLPIRARLTALYFVVLASSFVAFVWVSDLGFRRSIETTVDNASRSNLETVRRVLDRTSWQGEAKVREELTQLALLWANGALFEVADSDGNWIFRPQQFLRINPPLPRIRDAQVSFATTNLDALQYRIALQRITTGGNVYEIRAAVPTEPFDQALDHFRLIEKEFLPVLVLLASLLGYWLSGRSLAPVNRIIETVRLIGAQNLSSRLEVPRARDELRHLTETLNAMLARIEASFKSITQFTADASHDLRTPVAVIRATAEITLRKPRAQEEYRRALSTILETSVDTSELLENLLTLARADAGAAGMDMRPLDLSAHVQKARERAALLGLEKALDITATTPREPVWVKADAIAIDRLLLILLDNAVKYSPSGGRCEIALSQSETHAQITVRDSGEGIPESELKNIFDRFYRVDRVRSKSNGGAGLGLAIARWIAEMHGGTIAAESTPGAGSEFQIKLPAGAV